jgi:CheY-like chemotaxis protein
MESEGTSGVGLRVPIVASDRAIRELVTESLTVLGQEATSVSNSGKALALLAQSHLDLMLVAYSLSSESDGLALAKKARENHAGLKIIMLTGSVAEALSTAMTNRVVDAIIGKPFGVSDVEEAVFV